MLFPWAPLPLLAGLFDLLENGALILVMWRGYSTAAATAASLFTPLKWTTIGVSVALLVAGWL